MAGNVRIYDLAKELGIDNAKCIELCEELNIGTDMTASSSVHPQQADRVRHRAVKGGLVKKSEPKQAAAGTAQRPARQQRQQSRRQRARPGEGRRRRPPPESSERPDSSAAFSPRALAADRAVSERAARADSAYSSAAAAYPKAAIPVSEAAIPAYEDSVVEGVAAEGSAVEAPVVDSRAGEVSESEAAAEAATEKLIRSLVREDVAAAGVAESAEEVGAKTLPDEALEQEAQADETAAEEASDRSVAEPVAEKAVSVAREGEAEAVAGSYKVAESYETEEAAVDEAIAGSDSEATVSVSEVPAADAGAPVSEVPASESAESGAAVSERATEAAAKVLDFPSKADAAKVDAVAESNADAAEESEADIAEGSAEGKEASVFASEAAISEIVASDVVSSHDASQTISSRPAPTSVSGKPIPPPPGRSRAITVDGEVFSPGVKRSRPASSPASSAEGETKSAPRTRRRRPDRRGAAHVDAVFTPAQTRLPSSAGQGKGKTGRGNAAPFRPNQQRRRKGGRRRRRSVEELRPLDQQPADASLADAPPPEGVVEIERASTAQEVAPKLNRTTSDMIKYFLDHQEMVTATQPLPDDLIELYAEEIGARVRIVDFEEEQEAALRRLLELPDGTTDGAGSFLGTEGDGSILGTEDDGEAGKDSADRAGVAVASRVSPRPPIVTIMGHVDHGKTTLLDAIRNTNVTSGEAGGITQHIGAYHAERNGQSITFIDTPGHEAFTAMRNRGANVTDIVVLVVAADDGLMPQTEEAIDHAQAADVPILVAINKVDLEGANADRARQQLAERGLVPEAWGGDTVMEEVSALHREGLDGLLESILLMAEVQELTAPVDQRSQGVVLESHKDVGRGPVATLLVREGTLKVGDPVVAGTVWGRVRALLDDKGETIQSAGPSAPVQVLGLSDVAAAGDEFAVAPSQKLAEKVGREREHRHRMSDLERDIGVRAAGAKLEDIFAGVSAGETVTLNLVLKSDVHGSLEALVASLEKLERDNLKLSFVRRGVGGITENDVQLAAASNATIIGFNVRPDSKARQMAVKEQVEMRLYEVIYKVTEDVEAALLGMLAPEIEEHVTGEAEVREVFRIRRVGMIAGCYVRSGVVKRGTQVRFLRDGAVIWRGAIRTLRRFQEDAAEVAQGFECGIGLSDFQDLKQGDVIEAFEEREVDLR